MSNFLETLANQLPQQAQLISEINQLYEKKLWHNITSKIEELVKILLYAQRGDLLLALYDKFLKEFQLKLNALKLASIVTAISRSIQDKNKALEFLEDVAKRLEEKKEQQALIVIRVEISMCKLALNQVDETRKMLDDARKAIDELGYVDNYVNAQYYRAKAEMWKVMERPNEYYKTELLHLAYTPIESLEKQEQQRLAYDLGKAALLGDRIYNFGELLGHPVVESLKGSQAEWLLHILYAFNRGDIKKFQQLVQTYNRELSQPVFKQRERFLIEKMQLMAIMELVFTRSASDRTIPFSVIAEATGSKDVELILLKALSLDLIRGVINEIEQTIYVSWVQPRVLDRTQIASLKDKVGVWLEKVQSTLDYLAKEGKQSK